jgi:hypothetical protein
VWSFVLCGDCVLLPSAKFRSMYSIDQLFGAARVAIEDDLLLSVVFVLVRFMDVIFAISVVISFQFFFFFGGFLIYLDGVVV